MKTRTAIQGSGGTVTQICNLPYRRFSTRCDQYSEVVYPEGTVEVQQGQPSLRDLCLTPPLHPALKRWAILGRPSGTGPRRISQILLELALEPPHH